MTRASVTRIQGHLVKKELTTLVEKLRNDVQVSHKMGRVPADYSLGFTNAAIYFEHRLNNRSGKPQFFDKTMAIGALPKPVALKTSAIMGKEEIFESLRETLILAVRNWRDMYKSTHPDRRSGKTENAILEALEKMDGFVAQMIEFEDEARLGKVGNGEDAPIDNQGVAIPPAPHLHDESTPNHEAGDLL